MIAYFPVIFYSVASLHDSSYLNKSSFEWIILSDRFYHIFAI